MSAHRDGYARQLEILRQIQAQSGRIDTGALATLFGMSSAGMQFYVARMRRGGLIAHGETRRKGNLGKPAFLWKITRQGALMLRYPDKYRPERKKGPSVTASALRARATAYAPLRAAHQHRQRMMGLPEEMIQERFGD